MQFSVISRALFAGVGLTGLPRCYQHIPQGDLSYTCLPTITLRVRLIILVITNMKKNGNKLFSISWSFVISHLILFFYQSSLTGSGDLLVSSYLCLFFLSISLFSFAPCRLKLALTRESPFVNNIGMNWHVHFQKKSKIVSNIFLF